MSRTSARLALLCALVGLGASGAAAYVHYRMLADPTYTSFCDISATWSAAPRSIAAASAPSTVCRLSIFGGIWFAFATLLSIAGLTARQEVRESVPAYLFAGSTLALAVVLYLGLRVVLPARSCVLSPVPHHLCRGDRALSGVRSGDLNTHAVTPSPRCPGSESAVRQSARAHPAPCCGSAAARPRVAFFPREVAAAARRRALPEATARISAPSSSASWPSTPRIPLAIPNDGAKVLIVKFNDYQCPACGQSYLMYKPILAKYAASNPGAVQGRHEGLPAERRLQCLDAHDVAPCGMRRGGCGASRAEHNRKGEALEDWLYTHQHGHDAGVRAPGGARGRAASPTSTRSIAATLELVKGDIALGQSLKVYADADLLHQRRQGRRRLGAAVLRPGDRVSSCSARSSAPIYEGAGHFTI